MKRAAISIAFLAILTTACSPSELIAEQILEGQEGIENVEIDESTGEVKIEVEGEDGGSVVIGGGDIPDGFPIDVPSGGEVQAVLQSGTDATVSLMFDAADFDTVIAFYEDWIEKSGSDVINKFESSAPKAVAWTVEDGSASYNISVSEAGEQTIVSLFVTGG
jgi:hypothetical protein